jgi:hypothetical protein
MAVFPLRSFANHIYFINEGISSYNIVVPNEPSSTLVFAAYELQFYLEKISGVRIPIKNSTQKDKFIFIGMFQDYEFLAPKKPDKFLDDDQYTIFRKENNLYLLGYPARSVLYAVYHLLELYGCRWFTPKFDYNFNLEEQIPVKKSLKFPDEDTYEKTVFSYRCGLIIPGFWKANEENTKTVKNIIDWMAKLRLNVVGIHINQYNNIPPDVIYEIEIRGLEISAEGHSWQFFLSDPISNEQKEMLTSHQTNILLANKIKKFLERHAEIDYFGPWGDDSSAWCLTNDCNESPANRAARFYLNLEPHIKIQNRDIHLIMIAYQDFLLPSEKWLQLANSTYIYICPIDRDHGKLLWDYQSKKNQKYIRAINKWIRNGYQNRLIFYTYYRKHAWHSLPVNFPFLMAREMSWCLKNGFIGSSNYFIAQDWLTYDVQHYVYAKLSWNPEIRVESVLKDVFEAYFQTNWKEIYAFQVILENVILNIIGNGYYGLNIRRLSNQNTNKILEAIKQLNNMIDKFRDLCNSSKNEHLKKYLESRELCLQYLVLKLKYAMYFKNNKSLSQEQIDNLKKFLTSLEGKGLFYKDPANRYLDRFRISDF